MEFSEKSFKLGMIAVMTAVKKTLALYQQGMSKEDVQNMVDELDAQLGLKQTEMQLLKRA